MFPEKGPIEGMIAGGTVFEGLLCAEVGGPGLGEVTKESAVVDEEIEANECDDGNHGEKNE